MSKTFGEKIWESLISETNSHQMRLRIKTSEAGRIFNVLEGAVRNIETLAMLAYLKENRINFDNSTIDSDLKDILASYMALQKKLAEAWSNLGEQVFEEMQDETHEELISILKRCEMVNWHKPQIAFVNLTSDRSGNLHAMNVLRLILRSYIEEMMDDLENNADEHYLRKGQETEHLNQLIVNIQTIEKLKKEYTETEVSKNEQIEERVGTLNDLRFKIELIHQFYSDMIGRQENLTEHEISELQEENTMEVMKLEQTKESITEEFFKLKYVHKQLETDMRYKRLKIYLDTESVIQKYDEEMWDKLLQYETISREYEKELVVRRDLEAQVAKMEKRFSIISKELRHRNKANAGEKEKKEGITKSVVMIQTWWRGTVYRLRTGIFKPKGKGKGKKSKRASTVSMA